MLKRRTLPLGFIMGEESKIQSKIIKYLESIDCYVFKTITTSKRGVSDIIGCLPTGRFIAIEVKAKGKLNNVTHLQQYHLDSVNRAGGIAFAADSLEMVKAILSLSKHKKVIKC